MKCSLLTFKQLPERTKKPHKKGICNVKSEPLYTLGSTSTACILLIHSLLDIGSDEF